MVLKLVEQGRMAKNRGRAAGGPALLLFSAIFPAGSGKGDGGRRNGTIPRNRAARTLVRTLPPSRFPLVPLQFPHWYLRASPGGMRTALVMGTWMTSAPTPTTATRATRAIAAGKTKGMLMAISAVNHQNSEPPRA